MKILVVGGLKDGSKASADEERCARALGKAIVSAGHILVNGCYNTFDALAAESAGEAAIANPVFGDAHKAIHTYVSPVVEPSHKLGQLRNLNVSSWDPGQPDWDIPAPLRESDALVVVGGGPGTHRVTHLCRFVGRPILPITAFAGAAKEAFKTELERFDKVYKGRVSRDDYVILDSAMPDDFESLARSVVALTSRLVSGNKVFVIMSFRDESMDTYETIKRACETFGLGPNRTDKDPTTNRIYQRIVEGIQRAAFVVADVTFESLNVYYELGYAEALGKDIIVVAKKGTDLPFDTRDIPTHLFASYTGLEKDLRDRIEKLTGRQPVHKQP
jgi:nucleoside 2-deoxyribosyltransferase